MTLPDERITMKIKRLAACAAVLLLALVLVCFGVQKAHTFTLTNQTGTEKTEQIQPLWGTVRVSGDCDTDVVFTDVETGEQHIVGYITHGMSEKIKLKKGRWYTVQGAGNLTLCPVTVRVA